MHCRNQPRFLANRDVEITQVLEIRLAPAYWNRIKIIVWHRRRTYSTLTRYCALRLARQCSLRWTPQLRQGLLRVQAAGAVAEEMHRHMMCLYGEDEKIIRLAALSLGLTITAFVRLAIELYLSRLVMEKHSQYVVTDTDLTWEGVRITEYIQIFATNAGSRPFYRHLSCEYFPVDSYW
mgnify:CR=1 FL=1